MKNIETIMKAQARIIFKDMKKGSFIPSKKKVKLEKIRRKEMVYG